MADYTELAVDELERQRVHRTVHCCGMIK